MLQTLRALRLGLVPHDALSKELLTADVERWPDDRLVIELLT